MNRFRAAVSERSGGQGFVFYGFVLLISVLCIFAVCNMEYKGIAICGENGKAEQAIGGIYKDHALEQYITGKDDELAGFQIGFATYGRKNKNQVRVGIHQDNQLIYEWNFCADVLKDNEYTLFLFPEKLKNVKGQKFVIRIETDSDKSEEGNNITIYSSLKKSEITEEKLYSGILKEGTLDIRTVSRYIRGRWLMAGVILIVVLIMAVALFCGFKSNICLEKRYLLFAIVTGMIYLMVLPYGVGPDENKHMMRIFEISEGYMISDKGKDGAGGRLLADNLVPFDNVTSYSDAGTYWNVSLDYDNPKFYTFGNTALYSPVSYLPQAFAVTIARLFTRDVFWIAFFTKLAGFGFCTAAIFFSLKIIPVKRECLLLIALLPMFIQQSVVITADGFLNGVAIVFTAYVLYLAYVSKEKITKRQIAVIYLCMILLGLCKIVFLPLCLLAFVLPSEKFDSVRNYWRILLTGFAAACAANLGWLAVSSGYLYQIRKGVDSGLQVAHVLKDPVNYLNVIYNTVLEKHEIIFWEFFGDGLGALTIYVNRFGYYFCAALLIILAVSRYDMITIKKKDKMIMLFAVISSVLLIFTSEYVQWTKVAADVIEGIQGRYFIPVALIICICLESKNVTLDRKNIDKYIFPFIGYINVFAIISCVKYLAG